MTPTRLLPSLFTALMLMTFAATAQADASADDKARILAALPELSADSISSTPIPGLYQIMMGGQISYISADGRFLVQGDVYDIKEERNLTEEHRAKARMMAVNQIGSQQMIVFSPEDKPAHTVTVFTDIDCGYCRKLHREMEAYNDLGIEVRYLFFPRSGPRTNSWSKAENVWCAEDRNSALTRAKAGVEVQSDACSPTPVGEHYQLGRQIGIRGTPAILAESGELIPGYVPADELLDYLED